VDKRFHPAEAALAAGDAERLALLLADDPELAVARSRTSHPTLLQCLVLTMPPPDRLEVMIDMLAAKGADLSDPLIAASGMDNVRAIKTLLDRGARIEGSGRWSPLEEALYWGHEAAAAELLARGASVRNLRVAAALGNMGMIAQCFDASGRLTAKAGKVSWPFDAVLGEIPETVRCDSSQIIGNALIYAAAWNRPEAIGILLDRGARINDIPAGFDFAGTALHYAALRGHRDMVDLLLGRGADPALTDAKIGKLAEDWADHNGHRDLADHLRGTRLRSR
jgi:ankyrin repeat protein